jgi:probable F420-dependent oxidoreductase
MKLGVTLRNMGPQSTPALMGAGAVRAEELGFDSLWITDHMAIPPDDAEGSGGRYTDPLTTLAWLAGRTSRIGLGAGVLILPYRPALPTAKAIATVQEFSGDRLLLGTGVGWMDAEFRALGVDRHRRGRITDETLAFLKRCFERDVVEANGQAFIFAPRPAPPPVYVGGAAPHALRRAVRFGHGWMPMVRSAAALAPDLATFADVASAAGVAAGPVTAFAGLPLADPARAQEQYAAYRSLGIERLVCAVRYDDLEGYLAALDALVAVREDAG